MNNQQPITSSEGTQEVDREYPATPADCSPAPAGQETQDSLDVSGDETGPSETAIP